MNSVKTIFLGCALALHPAVAFNGQSHIEVIRGIRDFINSIAPGAEIKIVPTEQRPPHPPWEQTPFTWHGMEIWIKRPSHSDIKGPKKTQESA